jgi:copper chaperone CopZ
MAASPREAAALAPGCLAPPPSSAELVIDGMTCGACVRSVESALARLPPGAVLASTVTLGRASVRFALVTAAQIVEGALSAVLPAAACADAESVLLRGFFFPLT